MLNKIVMKFLSLISIGTHDIKSIKSMSINGSIITQYFNYSSAVGAFITLMFTDGDNDGSINFTRSVYLSLDKKVSQNYMLPNLYPGKYLVYVYDIERSGKLNGGVNYPASMDQFLIENILLQAGEIAS